MENDNSHVWQLTDVSPQGNSLPEVQDNSGVHFEIVDPDNLEEYCPLTPEQKLGSQKDGIHSGSLSSDLSTKEGSEVMSSSSSSSDAESEADSFGKEENLNMVKESGREGLLKEMNNMLYEEVLVKVVNSEVELKFVKKKLESSQDEIARLKYENLSLVEELGRTIEKLQTSEDNLEVMGHRLRNEFHVDKHQLQDQLDLANRSIDLLQSELVSERGLVSELQRKIMKTTNDLRDCGSEIEELKLVLHDSQDDFSKERSQFLSDINILHEEKDALGMRLREAEYRNKLLEEQIQQYEVEKAKTTSVHEAREAGLLDGIKQLKAEMSQKCELVDSLSKSLDASKLKYDMLKAEKDEVSVKVQKLGAEVHCRDIHIKQMEERIGQLTVEREELLAESRKAQKLVEELRLKVMDQERELEKQITVICDMAEEKREAIRQLCFALEHYRSGYRELRLAFFKHNRPVGLATQGILQ